MRVLILKQWRISTQPIDTKNNFISITGSERGLISGLLALIKKEPLTTLEIGRDRIEFTTSSIAGRESRFIALLGLSSFYYRYAQPWKPSALLFTLFLLLGILAHLHLPSTHLLEILILFGGWITTIHYSLHRTLTIGFVEYSGIIHEICFRRSIMDAIQINTQQVEHLGLIIQKLIALKERESRAASRPPPSEATRRGERRPKPN